MLKKLEFKDWAAVFALMALALAVFLKMYDLSAYPAEDAAILMHYAKNLALGHGIVWNPGDKPLDGATDFLPVIFIAAVMKAGAGLEWATRGLGLFYHLVSVFMIYLTVRTVKQGSFAAALFSAAYFAFGPGLAYIQSFFSTPLFAMFGCFAWYFANRIMTSDSRPLSLGFAFSCLLMGLTRSEGVLMGGFMLAAVIWEKGFEASVKNIFDFILVFATLGGFYFIWHWHHFGAPFPNPFYVKRSFGISPLGLKIAFRDLIQLTGPFLTAFIFSGRLKRQAVTPLIPVIGFSCLWMLLSDAMNFLMRYQYIVLPIVLMSWTSFLPGGEKDGPELSFPSKILRGALLSVLAVSVLFWEVTNDRAAVKIKDGRYEAAKVLHEYAGKNYRLAVTEAGLLPLYSGWRSMDTWGLNDFWIAHHGGITEQYLDAFKPQVIMFHAYFSPLEPPVKYEGRWDEMIKALQDYAVKNHYELAAVYGASPSDTHYYYVRTDFPESGEIIRKLRGLSYDWESTRQRAVNLAR